MIEEFGLIEDEINAWVPPKYEGSKKSMDRLAMFMRELRVAQGREFLVRKKAIIACLNEQGLSMPLGFIRHVAIPKNDTNFDPELATYVVEVRYDPSTYCIISFPNGCQPVITTNSYDWVLECLNSEKKAALRAWLNKLIDRQEESP